MPAVIPAHNISLGPLNIQEALYNKEVLPNLSGKGEEKKQRRLRMDR